MRTRQMTTLRIEPGDKNHAKFAEAIDDADGDLPHQDPFRGASVDFRRGTLSQTAFGEWGKSFDAWFMRRPRISFGLAVLAVIVVVGVFVNHLATFPPITN